MAAIPGGRIHGAHERLPGSGGDGFVVGHDRLRNAGEHFLPGPQADRNRQDGVAAVLDKAPRGPLPAGECADEGRQAWALAGLMLGGHLGFEGLATARTDARVSDERGKGHLHRRQCDALVSVLWCQGEQLALATGTGGRLDQADLRRAQPRGPVARMARTRPAWATRGTGLARGLVQRGLRRRWRAGGVRGALHTSLQRLNLLRKLVDTLLQALHMRLNGRWSPRPCGWGKGPRPETRIAFGWRCWGQPPQGSALRGQAAVLIGNLTSAVNAMMTSQAVERPLWSRTFSSGWLWQCSCQSSWC